MQVCEWLFKGQGEGAGSVKQNGKVAATT